MLTELGVELDPDRLASVTPTLRGSSFHKVEAIKSMVFKFIPG